jgi:hypothetical protein
MWSFTRQKNRVANFQSIEGLGAFSQMFIALNQHSVLTNFFKKNIGLDDRRVDALIERTACFQWIKRRKKNRSTDQRPRKLDMSTHGPQHDLPGPRRPLLHKPAPRARAPPHQTPKPQSRLLSPAAARRSVTSSHGRLHLRVPEERRRVDGQAALRRDRGLRRHHLRPAAPARRRRVRCRLLLRRPVLLLHCLSQLRRLPGLVIHRPPSQISLIQRCLE